MHIIYNMSQIRDQYLYRDPLLLPNYLNKERTGTPIILENIIEINVEGDPFIHNYIKNLNEEIFSGIPDGLNDLALGFWRLNKWSDLCIEIADKVRMHGWCIVVKYESDIDVYSVPQFADWIKTTDNDGRLIRSGVKMNWADDIGNSWDKEFSFDDDDVFLIKWNEGNGMATFAFPDLSDAMLTLFFEIRQIRGQYTFSASRPSFLHFLYGENIDDIAAADLDEKISRVGTSTALGVSKKILDSIVNIENKNIALIEPALNKEIEILCGYTRLPISFWYGERKNSGMSDVGAKTDVLLVRQKKEFIFNKLKRAICEMFEQFYDIDIDIELPQDQTMEGIEENDDNL